LISRGLAADKPAALISRGTTREQRVFITNIGDLPTVVRDNDIHAPTLIIIGEVVNLHRKLAWFEPSTEQR
jgi:uroporphyrin-III C-methyltransferase/precorrin-2 dehydrogenase/sirohydrochlorin ferrochelatase